MNSRSLSPLAILIAGAGLATAGMWTARPPAPAPVAAAPGGPLVRQTIHLSAAELAHLQNQVPVKPQQIAGITRPVTENFEGSPFPARGSKWTIADSCASLPGQNDVIAWGRQTAEMTVGGAGLWSVGGGTIGKTLSPANREYPTTRTGVKQCDGIYTTLLYSPLDFSGVNYGMRVTLDYKSKMPADALYIGVGDLDKPNASGGFDLLGSMDFLTDTGDDWQRGVHVELASAANVKKVLFAIIYRDPPPSGAGPMSTGVHGVFIDNVHLDAKSIQNPGYIPSPSPTPPPTDTRSPNTKTPTRTRTPRPPIPTESPTPTRPTPTPGKPTFFMPLALKAGERDFRPPPTAPSPTITPTRTKTLVPTKTHTPPPPPTDTEEPTETPPPTDTPVPTPTASRTLEPVPDVKIVEIMYEHVGSPRLELEILSLKNLGTAPQDMTGWRVLEEYNTSTCRIPAGTVIQPDAEYQIRSGKDAEAGVIDGIDGVICKALTGVQRPIWNNDRDKGILYDDVGDVRDCRGYDKKLGFYGCK